MGWTFHTCWEDEIVTVSSTFLRRVGKKRLTSTLKQEKKNNPPAHHKTSTAGVHQMRLLHRHWYSLIIDYNVIDDFLPSKTAIFVVKKEITRDIRTDLWADGRTDTT